MNKLFALALTTGLLSGIWGWFAITFGLIGWAGFLGCTAYFACPQNGIKGLIISFFTLCSGVFWAWIIINGSEVFHQLQLANYIITGIVAFMMCIQAKSILLSFVPGTFIGACATFANQGDWRIVVVSLIPGLIFGFAMKNSGLWLSKKS